MELREVKKICDVLLRQSDNAIRFKAQIKSANSRGVPVSYVGEEVLEEKVVLLKERFTPGTGKPKTAKGLNETRYILAMPDIPLYRDAIVFDNDGIPARVDNHDPYEMGGEPIFVLWPIDLLDQKFVQPLGEKTAVVSDDTNEEGGDGGFMGLTDTAGEIGQNDGHKPKKGRFGGRG